MGMQRGENHRNGHTSHRAVAFFLNKIQELLELDSLYLYHFATCHHKQIFKGLYIFSRDLIEQGMRMRYSSPIHAAGLGPRHTFSKGDTRSGCRRNSKVQTDNLNKAPPSANSEED